MTVSRTLVLIKASMTVFSSLRVKLTRFTLSFTLAVAYLGHTASSDSCELRYLQLPLGNCTARITDNGNQGVAYSWGIPLRVNGVDICAALSTFVSTPLFDSREVCSESHRGEATLAQCLSRRGNCLNDMGFSRIDQLVGRNKNLDAFNVTIEKETNAHIVSQEDKDITLLSGIITNWENHTNHHFPLSRDSTVLDTLRSSNIIGTKSFATVIPSRTAPEQRGTLTIGAWQPGMAGSQMIEYKLNYTETLNGRICPLQVGIQKMDITIGGEVIPLLSASNTQACIELYDENIRLPDAQLSTVRREIKRIYGLEEVKDDPNIPRGRYGEVFDLESGLIYRGNSNSTPIVSHLRVTLNGGLTVDLTGEDLVHPLRGLNLTGMPAVNDSLTEVSIYREPGIGDAPVLGRVLLSKLYMVVMYEQELFKLGLLNQNAIPESPVRLGSCEEKTSQSPGLVPGLGTGLALAVVILFIVSGLGLTFRRRLHTQSIQLGELDRERAVLGAKNAELERQLNSVNHELTQFRARPELGGNAISPVQLEGSPAGAGQPGPA